MKSLAEQFNESRLSRFLNRPAGRVFRVSAGIIFLTAGIILHNLLGLIFILWGLFPLSAGSFDICYISVMLGGPISGKKIRSRYQTLN